jgi:exodeoxyribonuclease VII large subunit
MLAKLADCVRCLAREMRRRLQYAAQALDAHSRRLVHPAERLRRAEQHVAQLRARLALAYSHRLQHRAAELARLRASLGNLDPYAVLARGYSITRNGAGHVLRDASEAREGERILTTLARGALQSEVKKRELL